MVSKTATVRQIIRACSCSAVWCDFVVAVYIAKERTTKKHQIPRNRNPEVRPPILQFLDTAIQVVIEFLD
jgi:hypothetical protein